MIIRPTQLESTQVYDFDREPEFESCRCCGCQICNGEKFCGDCLYNIGRE